MLMFMLFSHFFVGGGGGWGGERGRGRVCVLSGFLSRRWGVLVWGVFLDIYVWIGR